MVSKRGPRPINRKRSQRVLGGTLALYLLSVVFAVAPSPAQTPPDQRPGQLDKSFNLCKPGQTTPCDGRMVATGSRRRI
ncbi:MAG: hypothetical protein ACR2M4_08745 [Actinomycetota bacterium]